MARILLDHNIPHRLRQILSGHEVKTAFYLGWSDLANGDLITAAETTGFDVMITADKNLRYQQNLSGRRLALLVIESNRWPLVQRNVEALASAISSEQPGGFQEVAFEVPE